MLDLPFFRTIYSHQLSHLKIINNDNLVTKYYNNNSGLYSSLQHFYRENPEFDYTYFVQYYDLDKVGYTDELSAIMYYIRHKKEHPIINQEMAFSHAQSLHHPPTACLSGLRILLVSHELSLTGAPLVLKEFCDIYGANNTIHLINLTPAISMPLTNCTIMFATNPPPFSDYDIVIINTIAPPIFLFLAKIGYTYANNTILWVHEVDAGYYQRMAKYSFQFALLLTDSLSIQERFISKFPTMCRLYRVLKLVNFTPLPLKNSYDNTAGNFGTLCPSKNQIQILDALRTTNTKLLLVNQPMPNYRATLQKYIGDHHLENKVEFLPPKPPNEMVMHYNQISVYISSSIEEPFGKTLIESMESGIPIIALDAGSHRQLVKHNFNGLLYKNVSQLATLLSTLTPAEQQRMGRNGYIMYKNTYGDINRYIHDWNTIIHSIIIKSVDKIITLGNKIAQHTSPIYQTLECASFIHNNKCFIFGGYILDKNMYRKIRIVDLDTNIVEILPIPPNYAFTHICHVKIDNLIYFFSGQYTDGYGESTNKCYQFDCNTWQISELADSPFQSYCSRAFYHDTDIYVLLGTTENRTTLTYQLWKYSIAENKWTYIKDTDYSAMHTGFITVNNQSYIFGGNPDHAPCHQLDIKCAKNTPYRQLDDIYAVDHHLNIQRVGNLPLKKSHTDDSVCEHNGIIYIFGGQTEADHVTDNISIFIPESGASFNLQIPAIKPYTLKGSAFHIDNNRLIFFGGQHGNPKATSKFNDTLFIYTVLYNNTS